MRITCQRIGLPPISTSALGIACVRSCRRVPRPPHRIATGPMPSTAGDYGGWPALRTELPCRRGAVDGSAAGDGRQDGDLVAVGELRFKPVLEADVLPGDVDVDEPAQPAVLRDPLAELSVLLEDRVERLAHGASIDLDLALALGHSSELRGDLHGNGHRGEP